MVARINNQCFAYQTLGDHLGPKIPKNLKKNIETLMFFIFFPPDGNFDIDAGDGDGDRGGPFRTPKITKHRKK